MLTVAVWDVSATIAVISLVGALLQPVILYLLSRNARQNTRIETLVNGNLHKEQTENTRLRGILETNGIDHTSTEPKPDAKA